MIMRIFVSITLMWLSLWGSDPTDLRTLFNQAYEINPELPGGILECLAYIHTGLGHMPQYSELCRAPERIGLMGIATGECGRYSAVLQRLLDKTRMDGRLVAHQTRENIMATAEYLVYLAGELHVNSQQIEDWRPVLEAFSGLRTETIQDRIEMNRYLYVFFCRYNHGFLATDLQFFGLPVDLHRVFTNAELEALQYPCEEGLILHKPGFTQWELQIRHRKNSSPI